LDKKVLHIKNMVCNRCISTVQDILAQQNLLYISITLGTIELQHSIVASELVLLENEFKIVGFEIISEKNERIVKQIKSIILKQIFEEEAATHQNLSDILSEQLHFDYSHLSSIFSKTEGKSIQQYQNEIKVERIKELLEYDELSISEIAFKLGFGSSAYLATQFKKITGLTPSKYKTNKALNRDSLDIF